MSKLSELLKSQGVSAQQAAERAEKSGVHLRYGTIAAYWAGSRHGRPSLRTLTSLSEVTGIPLEDLQEAAWSTPAPLGAYEPPEEAALLDARQRRVLDELIRMLASSNGALDEYEQSARNGSAPEPGASGEGDETQEAGLDDSKTAAIARARDAQRRAAAAAKGLKVERERG